MRVTGRRVNGSYCTNSGSARRPLRDWMSRSRSGSFEEVATDKEQRCQTTNIKIRKITIAKPVWSNRSIVVRWVGQGKRAERRPDSSGQVSVQRKGRKTEFIDGARINHRFLKEAPQDSEVWLLGNSHPVEFAPCACSTHRRNGTGQLAPCTFCDVSIARNGFWGEQSLARHTHAAPLVCRCPRLLSAGELPTVWSKTERYVLTPVSNPARRIAAPFIGKVASRFGIKPPRSSPYMR
ncbi:hypothetical protein QBC46DRAFT_372181 [Diplogelasinospora grovesii]|uniref:Uncharacterized protein n=1 Tax=Diplogelasinospora grovesii TaxID=303347 RepID=A0AAN6NGM6_9PEZI|nr:hypothetical protein QBC46DRAFT_372181 [Diplogelasinospora grovesii]